MSMALALAFTIFLSRVRSARVCLVFPSVSSRLRSVGSNDFTDLGTRELRATPWSRILSFSCPCLNRPVRPYTAFYIMRAHYQFPVSL
ncbi:hypothetical protein F5X99DRAFT_398252 [Biscogniauxia marginata]|nr:hypothetical protein F5X99DRAFT_398252 [Biscogniauxia marginata]